MVEMACRHPRNAEYILPVASTIDRARLADFTAGWISHTRQTTHNIQLPYIHLVSDAREALYHARASIVASGTATVQAALIGKPFVVVYKVSPLTYTIAKYFISYPPEIWPAPNALLYEDLPIAMPNLIAGRRIVPELLQAAFNPETLSATLEPLLFDTPERARQLADLAEIRTVLTRPNPIAEVRDAVLQLWPSP